MRFVLYIVHIMRYKKKKYGFRDKNVIKVYIW